MRLLLLERITGLSKSRAVRDAIKLTNPTQRRRASRVGWDIWSALQLARLPANGPWKGVTAAAEGGPKTGCSWRVLVVDDEPMVAAMYKAVLESSGHRVTTAPDAARASAALMEQDFDLAVIDIALPQLDGWEVCRRINRTYPELPVIVASGGAVNGESVREQGACVSAVLSKPFGMEELLNAIEVAASMPEQAVACGP